MGRHNGPCHWSGSVLVFTGNLKQFKMNILEKITGLVWSYVGKNSSPSVYNSTKKLILIIGTEEFKKLLRVISPIDHDYRMTFNLTQEKICSVNGFLLDVVIDEHNKDRVDVAEIDLRIKEKVLS